MCDATGLDRPIAMVDRNNFYAAATSESLLAWCRRFQLKRLRVISRPTDQMGSAFVLYVAIAKSRQAALEMVRAKFNLTGAR